MLNATTIDPVGIGLRTLEGLAHTYANASGALMISVIVLMYGIKWLKKGARSSGGRGSGGSYESGGYSSGTLRGE